MRFIAAGFAEAHTQLTSTTSENSPFLLILVLSFNAMKKHGLFFPLRRFVTLHIVPLATEGLLFQRTSGKTEFRDEKNKRMNKGYGDFLR